MKRTIRTFSNDSALVEMAAVLNQQSILLANPPIFLYILDGGYDLGY